MATATPLDQIRLASMLLLGRALADLYPSAELIGGGIDTVGFYYDFSFEGAVDDGVFPLIEEKIRGWIQQDLPFFQSEMLQKNAVDFFSHHRRFLQAELLAADLHQQRLVGIARAGDFFDWVEGEMLPSAKGIGAFKLLDIIPHQEGWRVIGTSHVSKDALKSFLKDLKNAQKHHHLAYGKKIGWISEEADGEGRVLLKGGINRRREILSKVEGAIEGEGWSPIAFLDAFTQGELEQALMSKVGQGKKIYTSCPLISSEETLSHLGLFSLPWNHACLGIISFPRDDFAAAMKSSLKLIVKTCRILGFEVSWTLLMPQETNFFAEIVRESFEEWGLSFSEESCGKKQDAALIAEVSDLLGRRWKIASLRVAPKKPSSSPLQEGTKDGKNKGDKNLEERILMEVLTSAERVMAFELEADSLRQG